MTLVLQRIVFQARHGATAAERRTGRRFEVDVELDVPGNPAGRSDVLTETIDYRDIAETVLQVGTGEPRKLLEFVGQQMVDALLARFPAVKTVRLELRKPEPPLCPGTPAYSAVRLNQSR